MSAGSIGSPERLYLLTTPSPPPRPISATKRSPSEMAMPYGLVSPVINNGLTNAPEVVYSPIVSTPNSSALELFLTKMREPITASAVVVAPSAVISAGLIAAPESVYWPTVPSVPYDATNRFPPEIARSPRRPNGDCSPVMRDGLIRAPDVVYFATVPLLASVPRKTFFPDTAIASTAPCVLTPLISDGLRVWPEVV